MSWKRDGNETIVTVKFRGLVCLSVCPNILGRCREDVYGQICVKFGTLIAWVNPWGCFFDFFKILIFGPLWSVSGPKMGCKPLGCCREGVSGPISLKFGTLIAWVNVWGWFSHFFKILIFGPLGPVSGPKMDRKPLGCSREGLNGQIMSEIWHTCVNPWQCFFIFWKFSFLGIFGPKFGPKPLGAPKKVWMVWFLSFLCSLTDWANSWGIISIFWKFYLWGIFGPKFWSKILKGVTNKAWTFLRTEVESSATSTFSY